MKNKSMLGVRRRAPVITGLAALWATALTQVAHSSDFAALPVVKPVRSCVDLQAIDISRIVGRTGAIKSTEMVITDKGPFCKVSATVAPEIMITTYLPAEHWTQRYFQGRGGENPPDGFSEAATCQPALDGEFAYGLSNVRFTMVIGSRRGESPGFAPDPEKILDYSYRGNHVANQVSKALIEAYYGQGPRYSYFVGCSDGGRQGLLEAQRFPSDFDGIGAGSPGIISTAQESTFHIWKVQANKRPDGTNILMPGKLTLLHNAVVGHCATLSGVKDGILQDPNACHFDPAAMRCPADATRTTGCFTEDELTAIQKIYAGAHDEQGHYFYFGLPRGSESLWKLPPTATGEDPGIATHATQLAYILLPEVTPRAADYMTVVISQRDFEQASTRSPMFDAASTDLKPFAARGGKLILWHGLNDVMIPARATMAYYDGVEKFMGRAATSQFLRAFYPPGVGHCGGGDGYTEIDILSALMSWVESKQAPTEIVAGRTTTPITTVGAAGIIEPGVSRPYAAPQRELVAKRPLYPYPYIARYMGKGDPNDAANYTKARSDAKPWPSYDYEAVALIGPDKQRNYEVRGGRIQQVVGR